MAAMRYDKVEGIDAAWSPKVSAMYSPADSARLRASVGRGFHAPTVQELYEEGFGHSGRAYRFGNPDLEPEYSTTYNLGLELQPADSVELVLNGYYSDIDDMIVPVFEGPWDKNPDIDVWRRTNIENAEVYGGEAAVHWSVGGGVNIETGYTWTDNRNKETGRRLSYQPGSSVYGKLGYTCKLNGGLVLKSHAGVKAGFDRAAWNWKPAAGAESDNPDGLTTELKDYTKLDAGVTAVAGDYEYFVKVENILGEDIEYLDDALTIIDGEPVWRVGVNVAFVDAK
jgi:outer membrane receptor protein involved in Fe transport